MSKKSKEQFILEQQQQMEQEAQLRGREVSDKEKERLEMLRQVL